MRCGIDKTQEPIVGNVVVYALTDGKRRATIVVTRRSDKNCVYTSNCGPDGTWRVMIMSRYTAAAHLRRWREGGEAA